MDFFPIGVIYGGTLPRSEWDNDLREIAHAGFNCIRVSAQDHSEEDLDYILDLAEKYGLKVFVAFEKKEEESEFTRIIERLRGRKSISAWIGGGSFTASSEEIKSIDSSRQIISESTILQKLPKDVAYGVRISQPQSRNESFRLRRGQSTAEDILCTKLGVGPTGRRSNYGSLDTAFDTWSCIANGTKGIIYDRWDPGSFFQTATTPLRCIDGKLWLGLKRISQDIANIKQLRGLQTARIAKPNVALLVPSGRMQSGYPDRDEGAFQLLLHNQVSLGFINDNARFADLKEFQTIYAPRFYSCSREFGKALAEYVHSGGCLIAEAQVAVTDEDQKPYDVVPGAGLNEVFGLTSRKMERISADSRPVATTSIAQGVFTSVGANSRFFLDALSEDQEIQPGRSTILDFLDPKTLDPNGPAAVIGRFGEGKTAYISGSLGSTYHHLNNPYIRELMSGILDWMEVTRMAEVTGLTKGLEHKFELGLLEGLDEDGRRAIICINHSDTTLHPTITVPIGARSVVKELFTGSAAEIELSGPELRIMTHIPGREVRVYYEVER